MAEVDKIRHNIYHLSPNQFLRAHGFQLPVIYEVVGNQVEAVLGGMKTSQESFDYFMTSSDHKEHLLGENSFYETQNQIAVGFYEDKSKKYEQYWVVFITNTKSIDDEPLFKVKRKVVITQNKQKSKIRKKYNPKIYESSGYKK